MRPLQTYFGRCAPSIEESLRAHSELWGETVLPIGGEPADWPGLTRQNPVRLVYLTSGRNRLLHFGALPRRAASCTALAVGGPKPAGRSGYPGHGRVDYEAAVWGNLRSVPSGTAQDVLADASGGMLAIGMSLGEDEPFNELMERCGMIEARATDRYEMNN